MNTLAINTVFSENRKPVKAEIVQPVIVLEAPSIEEIEFVDTRRKVTDTEYNILTRVCMSEAGNQPLEGKIAVLATLLNRVDLGYGTIEEVVTSPNQYSIADNGEPNSECFKAVEMILEGYEEFPDNMIYFKTDYFHSFGTPYKQIGDHYFSLKE